MQAIVTKYVCPTNTKGSRVKATCQRGSKIIHWDDAVNADINHIRACEALCDAFATEDVATYGGSHHQSVWSKAKVSGVLPSGEHVHVFTGK